MNIVQNKIPIPNRTVEFTEDAVSLEDAMLLEDMEVSVMSLDILQDEELPDISVYASDIDKINIEFRNLNDSAKFKVTSENETIIEPSDIKENVYTLKYDFETPLEITVYNTSYSYKKQINPEDVRNLLAIANDEYLYLSEDTVNSNKRTLDGKYCNLYKNKILDKDGNIYDISTMNKIESTNKEIKLLDTQKLLQKLILTIRLYRPLHIVQKVTQGDKNTYKEQQIFVKMDICML